MSLRHSFKRFRKKILIIFSIAFSKLKRKRWTWRWWYSQTALKCLPKVCQIRIKMTFYLMCHQWVECVRWEQLLTKTFQVLTIPLQPISTKPGFWLKWNKKDRNNLNYNKPKTLQIQKSLPSRQLCGKVNSSISLKASVARLLQSPNWKRISSSIRTNMLKLCYLSTITTNLKVLWEWSNTSFEMKYTKLKHDEFCNIFRQIK